jgi:hypothetical protein
VGFIIDQYGKMFFSNTGERFYEMMFYFSSYVLRKVMVRDYGHGNMFVSSFIV